MGSIDLLEELKLNDYYPQKLSFSEAIKLRGESQNGTQDQYGLEIVRKLLTYDSTAVVSVTTDINERLNNTYRSEPETKDQCVANALRPRWKSNARPSWKRGDAAQSQQKLHPMDLLVVVMNCCDDLLRQFLVEKMFANKLSIPILLPEVKNGSHTLLLYALRSLIPQVQDRTRESSSSLTDTLVDIRNPVVSFIRLGNLHRSKSKLLNELLNPKPFNTFFHRECPNGSVKRSVSNGSIEAAWFQSEKATERHFNCRILTALNLRGNAKDFPKQTQFLCQSSTLIVFMIESFELFKELYEHALKVVDESKTKIIVCYISPLSPDTVGEKHFEFFDDLDYRGVSFEVKYDWIDGTKKMSDADFTKDLRETISKFLTPEHRHSNQIPTYAKISQCGKNFGFLLDEDKFEYELKTSADEFVDLVLKQPLDCKPKILPLQGEPWKKIGKLEREQRGKARERILDEHFIAERETEKRQQREIQCRSLIQQNEVAQTFSLKFHLLQDPNLSYYLNSCKIRLDARNQAIISNIIEECKNEKHENQQQPSNEVDLEVNRCKMEVKIANSTIGLEHILCELGQMYEAVISEEIRMKQELKKATLTPDMIRNFPTIVARLLLMGQPLELMDGDTSNVPTAWLKAVLNQVILMTKNAKVFVLSIIGVQSSGKSTLLNALFGFQCPVSAGRCTKGIYCHLVPVDKRSLHAEYDYVLVVDTEGLRASEFTGNSIFRDNELATFAIGLADATIINMKGENWAEMKDILQIVAHGLIRVRKTKAGLELMPRCMFVHQNVPAVDAEEKNRLGQGKQLMLLDKEIKAASRAEGFTDINKFGDVINYDSGSHSWYFPDLWYGKPPMAGTSEDYTRKANELRQHVIQVMKDNPSKLTISSFFLRMSDLWNAMLHSDFMLCFRNTKDIILGMVLNDRISHEMDGFKNLNKLEQAKMRESISSFVSNALLSAEKEKILTEVSASVEENFTNMKTILQDVINATDICASLKQKYEISLNALKNEELRRIGDQTAIDIGVHMKKLEYENDEKVGNLKLRMAELEKRGEEAIIEKLNETEMKEFEENWHRLIAANKRLIDTRIHNVERKIKDTICGLLKKLKLNGAMRNTDCEEMFKTALVFAIPEVSENAIVQNENSNPLPSWVMDFVYSKTHVYKARSRLHAALRKWELQFQKQKDLECDASHMEEILLEVGQLLGILAEVGSDTDEKRLVLPPGYSFTLDYIIGFIQFACRYTYHRSLENSKRYISLTDPLADIGDRFLRSLSHFQQMTVEANIDAVSKQIFDYAKKSFVRNLDQLIKTEVCTEDNENPTFKSKRAFLRAILTDLGQRTYNLTKGSEEKQNMFKEFMSYVKMADSEASVDFFLDVILKLLKEMLTNENASETDFQKMVKNNVGTVVEKAKDALRKAEIKCNESPREYIRIFKDGMNVSSEIDLRINTLHDFTKVVLQKIDKLYADFLSQANSSFENLVCEENKRPIRSLFEKIMGCRDKCPFCSAPCSQSTEHHVGGHSTNHYPMGVGGTVDISGLFYSTQETHDVTTREERKRRKLTLDTCQTIIGTRVDFRTTATVEKFTNWYHILFNWNYQSFKDYKEIAEYEKWDIPHSQDHRTSLYWKWFIAQFGKELAEHYNASCPEIPSAWKRVTWEEAKDSLDEPDLNFQFCVEEQC